MQKSLLPKLWALSLIITLFSSSSLLAHCQIPCGIYGDEMRIMMIKEHISTVEKSMNKISELSKADEINYNQLVRWIENKEHHAQEIQNIVTAYFLTQRIKPVSMDDAKAFAEYSNKTTTLQQMLFYAMKAKQTTDTAHCNKLTELTDSFSAMYFTAEDLEHLKSHK